MILYALFCILLAWINRNIIKAGKRVKHFYNGLCHLGACIWLTMTVNLYTGIAALFMARVVFDVSLNLMRGVGIGYVSPKPKSIVDKAEKMMFGMDGISPKAAALIVAFILVNVRVPVDGWIIAKVILGVYGCFLLARLLFKRF